VGIPRASRLRRSSDFQRVRATGRSWTNRLLVLIVSANDLNQVRVGVTASRRVGGAVVRVRARRLVREAVRPWLRSMCGGWDVVFVARKPLANASYQDVAQAVVQLLGRAGLLKVLGPPLVETEID
jgi:ribonuclease P protein component